MEIFSQPLNIFTWRPVMCFDISKKVSSEFSVASMLPCGIWKMPYGLREFTQHHHEVAQMMNFHIVGAQSPTRSSGLGRDRSDVRSKNTASLVSNTDLLLWCKPLIQMPLWPIFWFMMSKHHHTCDSDDQIFHRWGQRQESVGAYLLGWERRSSSPLPDSWRARKWQKITIKGVSN